MTVCRIPNHEGLHCGARTNGLICSRHIAQIRVILAGSDTVQSIGDLLAELDTTIARQDVGTGYHDCVTDDQIREHIANHDLDVALAGIADPLFIPFAHAVLALREFERAASVAAVGAV